MSTWPQYPFLYEINTWVWLTELSEKYRTIVDLASVPSCEWDAIAEYGFDAVWLMGVWERSPAGISIANRNQSLIEDFQRALPDFSKDDNVGSPYCVRRYVVDQHLGGAEGLAIARAELSRRGRNLVLDFVPNHVAPDHPWVREHPEYFIRGDREDARNDPSSFIDVDGNVFACGRDPFFPAWPDVLQLNAFEPGLRQAVVESLSNIAQQCDGVRCDMAMLVMNPIFERTWTGRTNLRPATEYWREVIPAVKDRHPGFLFIAEAYWDLEWELQQQGFDFCYDKKLYDRLEHGDAESVRLHLCADPAYQNKLLRFIENHDEPRAGTTFSAAKLRSAMLIVATLPGARLFHEGQFEGRKVRPPVFLGRRPDEPADEDLQTFAKNLLDVTGQSVFREGEWRLCGRSGWVDNPSYQNLVTWCWLKDEERYVIVVNLSDKPAQAEVQIPWSDIEGRAWKLTDRLCGEVHERDGDQMQSPGLYVDLGPWNFHFFELTRLA
ncbi:alpha-amylase [Alloacidobacterium dinghuense]|uniref:Alpha-amylase n=2 Tax=Alloacidobacterium dinghuense TaxID=2763107 RepID=A0A7G8BQH1_9BACT|nr:alpha-amylase [Alloacidobacterium dinghuense]